MEVYLIRDDVYVYLFESMRDTPTKIPIKEVNRNASYVYSHATDYGTAIHRIKLIGKKDLIPCKAKLELIIE